MTARLVLESEHNVLNMTEGELSSGRRRSGASTRRGKKPPVEADARPHFDVEAYLASAGGTATVVDYRKGVVVFSQGDRANDVRYLQQGAIKLSVL